MNKKDGDWEVNALESRAKPSMIDMGQSYAGMIAGEKALENPTEKVTVESQIMYRVRACWIIAGDKGAMSVHVYVQNYSDNDDYGVMITGLTVKDADAYLFTVKSTAEELAREMKSLMEFAEIRIDTFKMETTTKISTVLLMGE